MISLACQIFSVQLCLACVLEQSSFCCAHLKGKSCMDSILIILKKKMAQGLHLPLYWDYFLYHSYIQQISGERLQDHWSSCKEDHYTLLHTKYESSGPCGFGEEDFFFVFPMTTPGRGQYGPQGHGW